MSTTTTQMETLNEEKLHSLLGKMVSDMGAAVNGPLIIIGDKLGLYRALAEKGPLIPAELAEATGTNERYIREWCSAQAATGYINYHPENKTFSISPEQAAIFADESSPFLLTGGFYSIASVYADETKIENAFKTGDGISWGDHNGCLFCGVAKFFKPNYQAHLVQNWLPALEGATEKLRSGAKVADIGCGYGISTVLMAKAFPNSEFIGFDIHELSLEKAREYAQNEGVTNITFEDASAKDFPGENYDLITCFDCLHDMGDPDGAAAYIKSKLKNDGNWMIVEPFAHDNLEDNLNPVGSVYYGFSTMVCTPSSLSQEVGTALGAQAGEQRLKDVITGGGFSRFRRAAETPFNLILEARP